MNRQTGMSLTTGPQTIPQPRHSSGAATRRRVGIVGGGMAGVSLAWLLDGECDVVLLEARESLGGNVQSVGVELDGHTFAVDMGAQYFHPGPYPTYVKLLSGLGLYPPSPTNGQSRPFVASITLDAVSEPTPRFLSPVLPKRVWPVSAFWNWAGIRAFTAGLGAAKKRELESADWMLTLGAWLPSLGLTRAQWEGMLLPWAASLFSGNIEQARGLSARAAMIFAAKALPDNPFDPIVYYTLTRGMSEALRRMAAQFSTVQVLTRAAVAGIIREPQGGFRLQCEDARGLFVDDLVLASSGPATVSLLNGLPGAEAQLAALRRIEFHDARLVLHTDPVYAPPDRNHWSFLNCRVDGPCCEASMWLATVLAAPQPTEAKLPRPTAAQLWKSWVTHRTREPRHILRESRFQHMLPTTESIRAQDELHGLQGRDGLWIAGGYTQPYDAQETALLSALQVAVGLQVTSARTQMLVAHQPGEPSAWQSPAEVRNSSDVADRQAGRAALDTGIVGSWKASNTY